jgi:alpha-L-rhamnosidase
MRVIYFLLAIAFSIPIYAQKNSISVYDLRTEYKYNPLGIDTKQPRFSWKLSSTLTDVRQSSYEIRISNKGKSISTGKLNSEQSHLVAYNGEELKPLTRYTWQVRVWDNKSNASPWSSPSYFETGLMGTEWPASWIEPEKNFSDKTSLPPVYTRKEFNVSKKVASAQLIVTSRGLYRFYLNGKPVTDDLFTPGWTSYNKRLQYQVYDITAQLLKGKNAAGVILSEGWYRGTLGWGENRNLYGKKLGLLATIRITYSDGSTELVNSDSSWKATDQGPIRFSGIYDGEVFDANMELNGWTSVGFNDAGWWNVALSGNQKQIIVANDGEAVRRVEEVKPVKIFRTPKGEQVLDMGQNMVGWMRIRVSGSKGNVVKVYHAEGTG